MDNTRWIVEVKPHISAGNSDTTLLARQIENDPGYIRCEMKSQRAAEQLWRHLMISLDKKRYYVEITSPDVAE
jgi:hypothetical protein